MTQEEPPGLQPPTGPLRGLRVLELGQLIAGPFCGQLLGDLGADVIKVEEPDTGDPMRVWGVPQGDGAAIWWSVIARNKRSIGLDLRSAEGQDLVRQLVKSADVLLENFRPGTLERWDLDYQSLSLINPRLVLARISGYGQTGPYSSRAGYGSIGEAMGGLRYVVGDPSGPPSRLGISAGDTLAALFTTIGILSALIERSHSGTGQIVDTAIYEAVLAVMESLIPDYAIGGEIRERTGAVLPGVAPSNVYPTVDDQSVLLAANQDSVFRRLATAMGRPELATDPRYATHVARGDNQVELDHIIACWTATMTWQRLEGICVENGVPAGLIYRAPDMLSDPHFAAREAIVWPAHPRVGELPMTNVFPRLSRTPGNVRWVGPGLLGQHTDEVLTEIGCTPAEISRLRTAGVVT